MESFLKGFIAEVLHYKLQRNNQKFQKYSSVLESKTALSMINSTATEPSMSGPSQMVMKQQPLSVEPKEVSDPKITIVWAITVHLAALTNLIKVYLEQLESLQRP
ncbi:hypothetical protein KIN20_028951 [Parelaphostrongylus tenuis]|uniref:Uncharacterized protein n=1 Tax=Parelaphostrongylus tenuis TaxID=148309 RepID=A0AAD5R1Y6_PARTN|nr:hypothetical protein KIN20_028951 [Parelaphostrongylus tenuis]